MEADQIAGMIQAVLLTKKDVPNLARDYKGMIGQALSEAYRDIGITHANQLADKFPERFRFRNGQLTAVADDDTADVMDHINRTVPGKSRRGGRGGSRGGRAGGTSGRGSYGAAFGGGGRGGGFGSGGGGFGRGGGGNGFGGAVPTRTVTSFGSGGGRGSGGGFGSSRAPESSNGFGSGGGFGNLRAPEPTVFGGGSGRRHDASPPRNNYNSREESYPRSDNRGFASNYDEFVETSRRGNNDYDDHHSGRDNRQYRDEPQRYHGDQRRYEYDYDREPERDRDHYDGGRGGRDYSMQVTRTISNDLYESDGYRDRPRDDHYDRERDDRRGSERDDGYRNQQYDDDDYDRRRHEPERDREYRGRGESQYQNRNDDYDDDYRDGGHSPDEKTFVEEDVRREEPRRGFPTCINTAPPVSRSSIFAPQAYEEEGSQRRRSGEPEDPYQVRQPVFPTNAISMPPGFEDAIRRNAAPPGLTYPVGPPPGLNLPPCDPIKKTPSQRDQEKDPKEVSIEELAYLIFQAVEREGGKEVPEAQVIGMVLTHCQRDVSRVVQSHGGITRVLENVCKRASDRMEFYTTDEGEDVISLKFPYSRNARDRYGSKHHDVLPAMGLPDDVDDDDDDDQSYRSARSSGTKASVHPSMASSRGPVPSEIKVADVLWKYARTDGKYSSEMEGYGMAITEMADWYKAMSPKALYGYVSRPEFQPFFRMHFKSNINSVYAVGREGPLEALGGGEKPQDRTMREDSLASSTRGSGMQRSEARGSGSGHRSEQRGSQRGGEREADSTRPSSYRFMHKRDERYKTHRQYKGKEEVILTYFVSFYEFYVMTMADHNAVNSYSKDLYDDHCGQVFCDLRHWQKGHAGCYILPKEGRGYRVSVIDINKDEDLLKVRFVDSGEEKWIDVRDVVPLREKHKTNSLVFCCSVEDYDPNNEDDLWELCSTMTKNKDIPVIIEPQEKRAEENLLVVSFTFTPPGGYGTDKRYPEDLYRKELATPKNKAPSTSRRD